MGKGLQSALRPGLYPKISILGSDRRGSGRIVETYCRTIRLSPGKPGVILKWGLRNSVTRPNPGYNKGTIRGDMRLLNTHRSRGAMRERGVCDRFAQAEIVVRVAQIVAQKRASV